MADRHTYRAKTHPTLAELESHHTPGNAEAIYHYTRHIRPACPECDGQGGWSDFPGLVCGDCSDEPAVSFYPAPLRFDLARR